jgi:DNA-binding beta-propeller fold protein YncE
VSSRGIWVVNFGGGGDTVIRIDPENYQLAGDPVETGEAPISLTVGDDSVWVVNHDARTVSRIVGEPIPIGHHAGNITAGFGSIWVTSDYRGPIDGGPKDVVLVRTDPQTNQATETIQVGGHPIDVELTEDAVWVSVQGPDMLVKIAP